MKPTIPFEAVSQATYGDLDNMQKLEFEDIMGSLMPEFELTEGTELTVLSDLWCSESKKGRRADKASMKRIESIVLSVAAARLVKEGDKRPIEDTTTSRSRRIGGTPKALTSLMEPHAAHETPAMKLAEKLSNEAQKKWGNTSFVQLTWVYGKNTSWGEEPPDHKLPSRGGMPANWGQKLRIVSVENSLRIIAETTQSEDAIKAAWKVAGATHAASFQVDVNENAYSYDKESVANMARMLSFLADIAHYTKSPEAVVIVANLSLRFINAFKDFKGLQDITPKNSIAKSLAETLPLPKGQSMVSYVGVLESMISPEGAKSELYDNAENVLKSLGRIAQIRKSGEDVQKAVEAVEIFLSAEDLEPLLRKMAHAFKPKDYNEIDAAIMGKASSLNGILQASKNKDLHWVANGLMHSSLNMRGFLDSWTEPTA